jgi:hypothetical protein
MSVEDEFRSRGLARGGVLLLQPRDALEMVGRAREARVVVLGVDGFWITDDTTQPDLEHSIDLGADESSWEAAARFIDERLESGLRFEVVLDEESGARA